MSYATQVSDTRLDRWKKRFKPNFIKHIKLESGDSNIRYLTDIMKWGGKFICTSRTQETESSCQAWGCKKRFLPRNLTRPLTTLGNRVIHLKTQKVWGRNPHPPHFPLHYGSGWKHDNCQESTLHAAYPSVGLPTPMQPTEHQPLSPLMGPWSVLKSAGQEGISPKFPKLATPNQALGLTL